MGNLRRRLGLSVGLFVAASGLLSAYALPALALTVQYDTTFSTDGYEIIDNRPLTSYEASYDIAVQPDGKSIIVGAESTLDATVRRFNLDGTVDTSFGTNGIANFMLGSAGSTTPCDVAIQDDGKIVVAGYVATTNSAPDGWDYDGIILRLTANGSLDTTFSTDGYEIFDSISGVQDKHDRFYDVAIDSSGNYVLVGDSSVYGVVVRLTAAGAFDTTFSGDGIVIDSIAGAGGLDILNAVAVDPSNNIFATGMSDTTATNPDAVVLKLTNTGVPDATFDGDGYAIFDALGGPVDSFDNGKMLLIDGTAVVFAGTLLYSGGITGGFMARVTSSGSLDVSFDGDGKYVFSGQDWPEAITMDGDYYYVVGSDFRESIGPSDPSLWRFNKDASLDTNFDTDGQFKMLELNPFTATWGILYDLEVIDGKIYMVGAPYDDTTYAELTSIARVAFGNEVINLPVNSGLVDTAGNPITNPLSGTQTVRLEQTILGVPVVEFSADFTVSDVDLAGIVIDSSIIDGKAVVSGLVGTHTIFVPKRVGDNSVIICPDAETLAEVIEGCTNQQTYVEADPNVEIVTISGQDFWKVSGLTGTGGISTFVEGATTTLTPTGSSVIAGSTIGLAIVIVGLLQSSPIIRYTKLIRKRN